MDEVEKLDKAILINLLLNGRKSFSLIAKDLGFQQILFRNISQK